MKPEQQVREYLEQRVAPGDTLLAAVSGGADSVCLLRILHTLKDRLRVSLVCVHVHHQIRGEEADRDAEFVKDLCGKLQVPFVLKTADVPLLAKASAHTGIEEAARAARYGALREEAKRLEKDGKAVWICVAHNQEDHAETLLFHLFRGTSLRGLAGMPRENGRILRPLLPVSREAIEACLKTFDQMYRTDHTNEETGYARNRIRSHILAYAVQQINPRAAYHTAQTAEDLREAVLYLEKQAEEAAKRCSLQQEQGGGYAFSVRALNLEDSYIRSTLLHRALERLHEESGKGAYYQIGRVHVKAVAGLCDASNGRAQLDLPGNIRAKRLHDNLYLYLEEA